MSSQVNELLDAGDRYNARLWPALVNPEPLRRMPPAQYYSHNSAEELQLAIENMRPAWVMTPGALQLLMDRVGETPSYDTKKMRH